MERSFRFACSVLPLCSSLSWAVVIPTELMDKDASSSGVLYAFMFVVFIIGLSIGIWLQKRIGRPVKLAEPFH